jgi:predicted O-methyltransferase YrrM
MLDKELLAELFMGDFANPMSNNRMAKCEALYQMAREAWGGAIVELGTYHGCGAISLASGSRDGNCCPIYTIDDYPDERVGWAGERYCSEDEAIFWENIELADIDVTLIKKPVPEAFKEWNQPISLIFWDISGDDMLGDFMSWSRYLIPGALFAMHDTGDKRFGSPEVIRAALDKGWQLGPIFKGGYIVTVRQS